MSLRTGSLGLVALILLAACGPSVKQDPGLDGGKGGGGQKQQGNCQGDYAPISLFVPGKAPLADPENLPEGTYESRGFEYFVRVDLPTNESIQVHYSESRMGESPVIRPVCQGGPKSDLAVEYTFPALESLTITPQGKTRVEATYQIQGQRGRYTTGKVLAAPVATGLSGLLSKFTQVNVYETGFGSYEIRGFLRQPSPQGFVDKWVLQRIALVSPI